MAANTAALMVWHMEKAAASWLAPIGCRDADGTVVAPKVRARRPPGTAKRGARATLENRRSDFMPTCFACVDAIDSPRVPSISSTLAQSGDSLLKHFTAATSMPVSMPEPLLGRAPIEFKLRSFPAMTQRVTPGKETPPPSHLPCSPRASGEYLYNLMMAHPWTGVKPYSRAW